jgi:GT2 family glycosyltransferase
MARAAASGAPRPIARGGNGVTPPITTSIVIVTYNSLADLPTCLQSIRSTTRHPYEILLIDNGSSDGTREFLASLSDARVVLNAANHGFSRACNQGIREARGEYVLLLNPDTVLTPNWDGKLIAHFGEGVGAVGPLSDYVAGLQQFHSYLREPRVEAWNLADLANRLEEWNRGKSVETKLLIGFCLMLKRSVIDLVGMLDEELFLGNDDLEYSLRLRRHGLTLRVATDTFVHHRGQASFRSQHPEAVAAHLRESARNLHGKLVHWYGEGQVPTSTELWGIEVFGLLPDGSVRAEDPLIGCAA